LAITRPQWSSPRAFALFDLARPFCFHSDIACSLE
jgi:hypothetical protein